MPLAARGIVEITEATRDLRIPLDVLDASELYAWTDSTRAGIEPKDPLTDDATERGRQAFGENADRERALAAELIAAGATVHYPAILVYRGGRLLGEAIVGYKTAAAYQAMIAKRLALRAADMRPVTRRAHARDLGEATTGPDSVVAPTRAGAALSVSGRDGTVRDLAVPGRPGPYFRFVRGRGAVAFESGGTIYLLNLETGATQVAPGFVDFVPSPDGRLFVTPADQRAGLEFYDAEEVFDAAARGTGADVRPFYVDQELRDQYPSVGVLDTVRGSGATRIVYRVLMSWFDKVVFRDYAVHSNGTGSPTVRPVAAPVVACPNLEVSLPIMAQDGRELAARDEATATTKIFRLADDGACTELMDTGLQTGKVAWTADGRRIAFAIPRGIVRDGAGALWRGVDHGGELAGIFVLDREELRLTRVRGSEEVNRLAFPEFVGRDSIMFLLSGTPSSSRFRLVCCVP